MIPSTSPICLRVVWVIPGGATVKDAAAKPVHEDVWRYLFLHPVDQVGKPVPADSDVWIDQRNPRK